MHYMRKSARNRWFLALFFCALVSAAAVFPGAWAAAPEAGTQITNTSTADYTNGATGLSETVSSNTVSAEVNAVPGLTVSSDITVVRAPGDDVQFSYVVTNAGNTSLTVFPDLGAFAGAFSVNLVEMGVDLNGDGIIQPNEVVPAGGSVVLAAGENVTILVTGQASELAEAAETSEAVLTISASEISDPLAARAIVLIDTPTVSLAKAVSSEEVFAGDRLEYTLLVENTSQLAVLPSSVFGSDTVTVDGAIEAVVAVLDSFPEEATFDGFVTTLDFDPVYHVRGDDPYAFTATEPADLSTIDAVAFLYDQPLDPGETRELSFAVVVNSAAGGSSLVNQASVPLAQADGSVLQVLSNNVSTVITQPVGGNESITIYEDPDYTTPLPLVAFGDSIFVEVASAACNLTSQVDSISVVIETTPTGDRETVTAVETGPDSGVFRVGPIQVSGDDIVNVDDGILSAREDDMLTASPQCDPVLVSEVPVETVGFVFDSLTNNPVPDVLVQLVDENGVVVSEAVTDANGRYELTIPAQGTYRVVVDNLSGYIAPSSVNNFDGFGRTVDPAGSFGANFISAASAGRVDFDIPVDAATASTLSVNKTAAKKTVQIGELITYSVEIKTTAQVPVNSVIVRDELPWGFSYVPGTAIFDNAPVADPDGAGTTSLSFALGQIPAVSTTVLQYTVRVGPNSGDGDRINLATAEGQLGGLLLQSNVARETVRVNRNGTVFSSEGVVLGKVFLDCNENGFQDEGSDPGIPGVQINTQEGIYVVTDNKGRFSLPRLRAQTHVLDLYDVTLPAGTKVAPSRVMDAGNGGSRFVPLKSGEVRSEDFAVRGCTAEVLADISERQANLDTGDGSFKANPLQLDVPVERGFTDEYEKAATAIYSEPQPVMPQETVLESADPVVSDEFATLGADILAGKYATTPVLPVLPVAQPEVFSEQAALYPEHYASFTQEVRVESKYYTLGRLEEATPSGEDIPVVSQLAQPADREEAVSVEPVVTTNAGGVLPQVSVSESLPVSAVARPSEVAVSSIVPAKAQFVRPVAASPVFAAAAVKVKTLEATRDLNAEIGNHTAELDFLDLEAGDVVASRIATIRVKGPAAGKLALSINGKLVSEDQLGQSIRERKKNGIQLTEYIAVSLVEGENTLVLSQKDPFGNERGRKEITIKAAGDPVKVSVFAPESAAADPQQPFPVLLRLVDKNDLPVVSPVEITLSAEEGEWLVQDIRDTEPGIQSFINDGQLELEFRPSGLVGTHALRVKSTFGLAEVPVQFTADINRPPVVVGFIEGAFSFSESSERLEGLIEDDDLSMFEETEEGINGEVFLKGKIRGDALLTMRYDSDKETDGQLFRDIEPDRFYPVYGDRSQIGFDARSQGKLFVKLEKGLSYLLYGDVRYNPVSSAFQLGAYQRTLEGAKAHLEKGRVQVDLYAAETDATQTIIEIPGQGISGPYALDFDDVVENSERVEILVRDRDQPSVIISTQQLTRFANYTLDYFDRSIIFSAPVESIDENLNPVSIRVTFENNNGAGEKYYVYGGEARYEVNDRLSAGYRELRSDAPGLAEGGGNDRRTVRAGYVEGKVGDSGVLQLEVAQTTSEQQDETTQEVSDVTGEAVRLSYTQADEKGSINARIGYTDENFDAPGANQSAGTFEARLQGNRRVGDKTSLKAEGLYSEDTIRDETRYGVVGRVERNMGNQLSVRAGARYAETDGVTDEDGNGPDALVSVIAGASWAPHFLNGANLDAEFEQSLTDSEHFRVKFGADYAITPKMKAYILSEWSSSDRGAFAIGESSRSNTTIRGGVEAKLTDNVKAFSEYRANQGVFDAGLANGVAASWEVSDSLQLRTRVEHVEPLTDVYQGNSAASVGATWQPEDGRSIVSGDVEYALSQADRETWYVNNTAGIRSGDVTFLARNRYARTEEADGDRVRDRLRVGAAYRPASNEKVNALAWYEYAIEEDSILTEETHLWSFGGEYKPDAVTRFRPRYAGQFFSTDSEFFRDENTLHMLQLGADRDVTDRVNLGINLSGFTDEGFDNYNAGIGVEGSFVVMENVLLGLGYNYGTLEEEDFRDLYQEGFFVRLRVKFDENSWNIFSGD